MYVEAKLAFFQLFYFKLFYVYLIILFINKQDKQHKMLRSKMFTDIRIR